MAKREIESMNTDVMKLVKTDKDLAADCRLIADALVGKMTEMRARDMVVTIGLNNGSGPDKTVKLNYLRIDKIMDEVNNLPPQGPGGPQG